MDKEKQKEQLLFTPCKDRESLHLWIKVYFGLDIPDCIVDDKSTASPFDMIWECYSHFLSVGADEKSRIFYYASRDSFKTLNQSIFEALALLHLGCNIVHLASIEEQSKNAQKYVRGFLRKYPMSKYVVGTNAREIIVTRFYNPKTKENLSTNEWKTRSDAEKSQFEEITTQDSIIVANIQSCNGKHAPIMCLDEIDVLVDRQAYFEAKMIPCTKDTPEGKILPLTILTSTRKTATGLAQNELDKAHETGLLVRHWNLIDVTEACPPNRHRPDEPKVVLYRSDEFLNTITEDQYSKLPDFQQKDYTKDIGFAGCVTCPIFAACKSKLATHQKSKSALLKPIQYTVSRFKENSLEMIKSQLLCWKPTKVGLIYPYLDRDLHIKTAAQIYEMVFGEPVDNPHYCKQDLVSDVEKLDIRWVAGMDFGFSHSFAVVLGFIYGNRCFIIEAFSVPEFELSQQIDLCNSRIKKYDADIWADPENPSAIKTFRSKKYKMRAWKKGKGSVVGGIETVRMKIRPVMGDPELFFLANDLGVGGLFEQMSKWYWKTDQTGVCTDDPAEEFKDLNDACRYMVMNNFASKATLSTGTGEGLQWNDKPKEIDPNNWLAKAIADRVGEFDEIDLDAEMGTTKRYGRKGGLVWDI